MNLVFQHSIVKGKPSTSAKPFSLNYEVRSMTNWKPGDAMHEMKDCIELGHESSKDSYASLGQPSVIGLSIVTKWKRWGYEGNPQMVHFNEHCICVYFIWGLFLRKELFNFIRVLILDRGEIHFSSGKGQLLYPRWHLVYKPNRAHANILKVSDWPFIGSID